MILPRSSSSAGDGGQKDQSGDSGTVGDDLGPQPTSLGPPPTKRRSSSASKPRPNQSPAKRQPLQSNKTVDSFVTARECPTSPEGQKSIGATLQTFKTAPEVPESSTLHQDKTSTVKGSDKEEVEGKRTSIAKFNLGGNALRFVAIAFR